MEFSPQQDQALKAISDWYKDPSSDQVFYLAGYAGTGKTTLAKHIAADVDGKVLFGAFTGKAAMVLQNKGCEGASTIHSMIYNAREMAPGVYKFVINKDGPMKDAELVMIDECSMVGEALGVDLLSFKTKVLVIGDPAQLPPVKSAGFFTERAPDFLLTEVHRQARDNPIIAMSMKIRNGEKLEIGDYGQCTVISRADVDQKLVMDADQILVGLNRTRHTYNDRMRQLLQLNNPLPEAGEKLVCLKNAHSKGLLNGSIWSVYKSSVSKQHDVEGVKLILSPEDEGYGDKHVEAWTPGAFFRGAENTLDYEVRRVAEEFTFGYALTVHKSQGSQWNNVMLFDESASFRDDWSRWLYTGVTRAAEKLTVVQ